MIVNHRLRFRQSEFAKAWNNISASEAFIQASAAAMLEFAATCPSAEQMKAVQSYLHTLISLTDPEPKIPRTLTPNLDHKV